MNTKTITAICLLAASTINAQTFDWAKSFGSFSSDEGNSITVDASGNVYTVGYFRGSVDFDPYPPLLFRVLLPSVRDKVPLLLPQAALIICGAPEQLRQQYL